jgi:hypothetical protein
MFLNLHYETKIYQKHCDECYSVGAFVRRGSHVLIIETQLTIQPIIRKEEQIPIRDEGRS